MKTFHLSIIIGIMCASCFVLSDAYAQDCMGGQYCGGNVQSTAENRNVTVSLNFYSNSPMPGNVHYLWLRFFDAKNDALIKNVSFFINATKGDNVLMHELFYTKTGLMLMKFYPAHDTGKLIINGTSEPMLGGMMSENDTLPITTSVFTENGTYHIHLEVLATNGINKLVDPRNPITFDSQWLVDEKGKISKYDNNIIRTSLKLENNIDANKIPSPLKQFNTGIASIDIKCNQGLQAVIRYHDEMPLCVKYNHIQKMQDRNMDLLLFVRDSRPSELTVDGLRDSYSVGETIDFTIKFKGIGYPCTVPTVFVTNDRGKIVWTSRMVVQLCDPEAKYGYQETKWKLSDLGNLQLDDTSGSRRLIVFYNNKTLTRDFWTVSHVSTIGIPAGFSENRTGFKPLSVTVKIGSNETVRWINNDTLEHKILADNLADLGFYDVTHFDSFYNSTIKPTKYFEYHFMTPGKIGYTSESGMNGTVTVLPPDVQMTELQIQPPDRLALEHGYSNDHVSVMQGFKVSWENIDNVTHTITSNDGKFDSGPVKPRTRFTLDTTALSPGYYDYFDKLHPYLVGGIRIVAPVVNESYNQVLIEKAKKTKESQMFFQKYPGALTYVENNYYDTVNIRIVKQVYPPGMTDDGIRELRLEISFDRNHDIQHTSIRCEGPITLEASNVTGYLQHETCFNSKS